MLKQSFIEKYKNRATIEVDFIADYGKGEPSSASARREDQTILTGR